MHNFPSRSAAAAALFLTLAATFVDAHSQGCPLPNAGAVSDLVQPAIAPVELLALIEIPAGSATKYELHPSGRMAVDRFLAMPMAYPVNYGFLPCTHADDGDALDVLVLSRFPIAPGTLIRVRPVGVLRMIDRGEADHKILAVPVNEVDATFSAIGSADDLPAAERDRIMAFFRTYKLLPEPASAVTVGPWEGPAAAADLVRRAIPADTSLRVP
jgi:inorganic pyrophosphatase